MSILFFSQISKSQFVEADLYNDFKLISRYIFLNKKLFRIKTN
jgi:hypothetical protein